MAPAGIALCDVEAFIDLVSCDLLPYGVRRKRRLPLR